MSDTALVSAYILLKYTPGIAGKVYIALVVLVLLLVVTSWWWSVYRE